MGWHTVAEADAIGDEEALGVKVGEVPIAIVRAGGAFSPPPACSPASSHCGSRRFNLVHRRP